LAIFYFLFQKVFSLSIQRYSLFTFCGVLAWNWFQNSLTQATSAIVASRELVRQPSFHPPILPLVTVATNCVNFLLALVVLLFVMVISGTPPRMEIIWLPLIVALQFILTAGGAYFLAAVNVIFRDTQHIVAVLLQLYFFVTPIFYDVGSVPAQYRSMYMLNPMVHIVGAYRALFIKGTPPEWLPLWIIGGISTVFFFISLRLFKNMSYRFVEEL
jgi:lipopolysaccharide transport system permease protein